MSTIYAHFNIISLNNKLYDEKTLL